MKLIKIVSELANQLDEILMVVPDGDNKQAVLAQAADVLPQPTVEREVILQEVGGGEVRSGFDVYREYWG